MSGKTGGLLMAALLLVGCSDGEARSDGEAVPSADAPRLEGTDTLAARSDTGAVPDAADPDQPVADGVGEPGTGGDAAPGASTAPEPGTVGPSAGGGASGAAGTDGGAVEPSRPSSGSSQQSSPESVLRATSAAYEGLRSFRAGFDQTLRNTLLGRTTRSQGTLYQRQPDRFLMEFSDPPNDLIVSDGEYFWMYYPSVDAKQVIRTRRGGQGLDLHAQFIGDPVRRFEFTYHGTEAVRGRSAHVMTLVPREALGYERLKVWIDDDDHLVRRFELTEGNGNVRHFELSGLVRNPSLGDELFEFTPPPGAQVIER